MKIIRIFAPANDLIAVRWEEDDLNEFEKIFDRWTDPSYLDDFFSANERDLGDPIWEGMTIAEANKKTRIEAIEFLAKIISISKIHSNERLHELEKIFVPLTPHETDNHQTPRQKAYGPFHPSWLRLYAIRLNNSFVITGGAIKLTQKMNERPHTSRELLKLTRFQDYLRENGILDKDGIAEFLQIEI